MIRVSMAQLIERVRDLTEVTTEEVSDTRIQEELDHTRYELRTMPLVGLPTYQPGGRVEFFTFTAPFEDWEDSVQIQHGGNWSALTPTAADLSTGRWTFAANYYVTLFVSGFTYDRYAAAASVLELASAKLLRKFDISADGQSFNRRQIRENYLDQAKLYRQRARAIPADIVRSDMTPGGG